MLNKVMFVLIMLNLYYLLNTNINSSIITVINNYCHMTFRVTESLIISIELTFALLDFHYSILISKGYRTARAITPQKVTGNTHITREKKLFLCIIEGVGTVLLLNGFHNKLVHTDTSFIEYIRVYIKHSIEPTNTM